MSTISLTLSFPHPEPINGKDEISEIFGLQHGPTMLRALKKFVASPSIEDVSYLIAGMQIACLAKEFNEADATWVAAGTISAVAHSGVSGSIRTAFESLPGNDTEILARMQNATNLERVALLLLRCRPYNYRERLFAALKKVVQ